MQSFHPALSRHPCLIQISETKISGMELQLSPPPQATNHGQMPGYTADSWKAPRTFYCLEIGEKSKVLYNKKKKVVLSLSFHYPSIQVSACTCLYDFYGSILRCKFVYLYQVDTLLEN